MGTRGPGDQGIRGSGDQGIRGPGDQGIRGSGDQGIRGSGGRASLGPPVPRSPGPRSEWGAAHARLVALLVAAGILICAGLLSPTAVVIVLREGPIAAAIILAAAGLGLWIMRALGLHEAEVRWQVVAGTGFGLGAIALLVLGLGALGIMQRAVWIAILLACAAAGAWRARGLGSGDQGIGGSGDQGIRGSGDQGIGGSGARLDALLPWLWVVVIAFGGLAILAGTMPPGILWPAEGNGYDVLEYHLAAPREYLEAGRIVGLPHNIYSNFPFNVEMLYLLTMVLRGGAVEAAFAAGLLNLLLGGLAVAAAWLAGREFGRGAGVVTGVLAASCPFVVYLSGITYVENGLLFFSALAVATFLRTRGSGDQGIGGSGDQGIRGSGDQGDAHPLVPRSPGPPVPRSPGPPAPRPPGPPAPWSPGPLAPWRWLAASGLLCGLACGCKYTAVPMVLLPMALAVIWLALRPQRSGQVVVRESRRAGIAPAARVHRLRPVFVFLAGWAVAFAPWLVKNAVMTGNPVFPLGRTVFAEREGAWDEDGARRWHEGHLPAPEDLPFGRRLQRLWHEVVGAGLFAAKTDAEPTASRAVQPSNAALFGPAIGVALLAGVAAAVGRLRKRIGTAAEATGCQATGRPESPEASTAVCWLLLVIGIVIWLGFTHLAGRFAIVLIVPAALVLAAAWSRLRTPAARSCGAAAMLVLVAVNLNTTIGLFRSAKVFDISDLRDQHRTDGLAWFTEGEWPWHAHVPRLNALADEGAKILMVGDARRFYLHRGVDYCVVFNRNPFAEAAAKLSASELLDWLRGRGYGYVYVDWIEMHRLRASRYGFWPSVDVALFERLLDAGLIQVQDFMFPEESRVYGSLFAVPAVRSSPRNSAPG